jgi:hypothetical protein
MRWINGNCIGFDNDRPRCDAGVKHDVLYNASVDSTDNRIVVSAVSHAVGNVCAVSSTTNDVRYASVCNNKWS